jgi:hypothetical protein
MAIEKKTTVIKKTTGMPSRINRNPPVKTAAVEGLSLPDKPSTPSSNLSDFILLIHGFKKIGKTTLASKFPEAFFLCFEPGTKSLSVFKREPRSWEEFISYVDLLEGTDKFKTVVIDTVDEAYEMCFDYCCRKYNMEHPGDEEWGKGWKYISKELSAQFGRLFRLGRGVILISHSKEKEVKPRYGRKYTRIEPTLGGQAAKYFEGITDIWAYYCFSPKGNRMLILEGDQLIAAGRRMEENFITSKGERVISIPMGKSSTEAYQNFLTAFHNKQKERYAYPKEVVEESEEDDEE